METTTDVSSTEDIGTEDVESVGTISGKVPSIELEILRAGVLIVAITGFLWQLE